MHQHMQCITAVESISKTGLNLWKTRSEIYRETFGQKIKSPNTNWCNWNGPTVVEDCSGPLVIGVASPKHQHSENDPWTNKITANSRPFFFFLNQRRQAMLRHIRLILLTIIWFQRTWEQMNENMVMYDMKEDVLYLEIKHSTNEAAFSIGLYATLPSAFRRGGMEDSTPKRNKL